MRNAFAVLAVLVVVAVCVACGGSGAGPPPSSGQSSAVVMPSNRGSSPAASSVLGRHGAPPAANARLPRDVGHLAGALTDATRSLRSSIRRWTTDGDPSAGPPPQTVQLWALYQQRIYGFLADHRALARRTASRLPHWLRPEARANLSAILDLLSLVHPVKHPVKFEVIRPKPAGVLLRWFKQAQRRFRVSWTVLAAVNYIESKFGRVRSNSYAGAQGPMQFVPSTWRAYGLGGDVHDPHDAIMGAANYLHASGAPTDYRRALYSYNPAQAYVDAILTYAHRIRRDPAAYYEYYSWQVFVRTKHGAKRLTGPGL
jgi:hypothetical protein